MLSGFSLDRKEVATFVISSKTPSGSIIEKSGYLFVKPGVMQTKMPCLRHVTIISLNDLPDTPHNQLFKLFASKFDQKTNAFAKIEDQLPWAKPELMSMIKGLYRIIYKQEQQMPRITTQDLIRIGTEWAESVVANAPVEKRLEGIPVEARIEDLSKQDLLQLNQLIQRRLAAH